jgi:predicted O-linked N-acetylglucosamine transferase (SPINDLY family)
MDYRITDRLADPEESATQQHSECLAYLSRSQFNYRPPANAPDVQSLPALRNGWVTFGSLNNAQKLNRSVIAAWSQILLRVPGSRLLLHHKLFADPGVRGRIRGLFEAHGIGLERLDLRPFSVEHLPTYHAIDIALDPFPYNGAATTCEALWMGVPVVALAGNSAVSRMGVSILEAAGLSSWLAHSVPEYIDMAVQQCAVIEALAAVRNRLRDQLLHSALCDEAGFAADFGRCLERMGQETRDNGSTRVAGSPESGSGGG